MGWIGAALGLAIGGVIVWLWARKKEAHRRHHALDAAAHGRAMEAMAPALLSKRGFTVLEDQVSAQYGFLVDGEEIQATLRADFLVRRGGRTYVVEVKTGEAAKPTRRGTRRQLLEYFIHYDVDGVLLLNADQDAVYTVEFPVEPEETSRWTFAMGLTLGAVVTSAAWWALG